MEESGQIAVAAVSLVAALFLFAAARKIAGWRSFLSELRDYALIPAGLVRPAALGIVVLEVGGAVASLVPSTRTVGAVVLAVLLAAFTAAVVTNLLRGRRDIPCACFGPGSSTLGWSLALRNTLLAVPPVAVLALPGNTALGVQSVQASAWVTAGLAAVLLCVLFELARLVETTSGTQGVTTS